MKKRIVIIGGGAAGFFSAINIAEKKEEVEVMILEKTNKLLSKVSISGGGRCNVTHACFDPKELTAYYPRGQKELLGPFHQFSTGDTIEWFANRGVELKMEDDGRMFPVSDSSQTIIDCFLAEVKRLGIKIRTSVEVQKIEKKRHFHLTTKVGETINADVLVMATGGSQKLKHYDLLSALGHNIISPIPSLFTFNLPKHASNKLMGVSSDASVRICDTNFEEYGPVLFTHWGMSGPAILKLSSKAARFLHSKSYQFSFEVEWYSDAEGFIEEQRRSRSKQKIANTKFKELPNRLWEYLLTRSTIDLQKNWADLSKKEMLLLKKVLSSDTYQANGKTTFKEEFVSCGGVELSSINMKTMESKLIEGLYFCGEVINVDALTGGFNFQAAWTSGFLVANAININ